MSIVQTTAGTFGINGSLNVQNILSANEVDLNILKINGTDVTSVLQNDAAVATNVTNIISGSQVVGNATNSVNTNNVLLSNDISGSDTVTYIPFSTGAIGQNSLKTNALLQFNIGTENLRSPAFTATVFNGPLNGTASNAAQAVISTQVFTNPSLGSAAKYLTFTDSNAFNSGSNICTSKC